MPETDLTGCERPCMSDFSPTLVVAGGLVPAPNKNS
jgi:hypothetical protein